MLDATPLYEDTISDWQNGLRRGAIVSFVYPTREGNPAEPPKARPCLVTEIEERAGHRFAELAYGTTSMGPANKGYEVRVLKAPDYEACGLREPTRFVCARRIWASLTHSGFRLDLDLGTPVIGQLTEPLLERLNAVRARLHAETDIAADRRTRRRETRRIRVSGGREVVVEHRHPRAGASA
jgi:hypothetical protein